MKYKLGQLVEQYDEINDKGEFQDLESLQGINSLKYFQECKSNKNDIDLFRYRICRKGMFAYNRATSRNGEKISIAYREGNDCLISPSYYCFKIVREDLLLADYLMIWLKRPIFDKYARFHSWGSATEFFTFEDFCDTEINLPSIKEQRKIVHDYKVITDRIELLKKININLEEQVYCNYLRCIENFESNTKLSELANICMGTSPEGDELNDEELGEIFYQGKTDFGFRYPSVRIYTTGGKRFAQKNDILMSVRAPVGSVNIAHEYCAIGRGLAAIRPKDACYSFLYYTMKKLEYELNKFNNEGTVFGSINKEDLFSLKVSSADIIARKNFEMYASKFDKQIENNEKIIDKLSNILSLMMLKITKEVA